MSNGDRDHYISNHTIHFDLNLKTFKEEANRVFNTLTSIID